MLDFDPRAAKDRQCNIDKLKDSVRQLTESVPHNCLRLMWGVHPTPPDFITEVEIQDTLACTCSPPVCHVHRLWFQMTTNKSLSFISNLHRIKLDTVVKLLFYFKHYKVEGILHYRQSAALDYCT